MPFERTLSIIKPNAMSKNIIGEIIRRFESNGLRVAAAKMTRLTMPEAEGFYAEHKERPFFETLCYFMASGPVMLMVLEGEGAVAKNREIMGATNPADAAEGTIRKDFGDDVEANTVHGSDSTTSANREIFYFFKPWELVNINSIDPV